jgi:GT2 family glycosyltransferase
MFLSGVFATGATVMSGERRNGTQFAAVAIGRNEGERLKRCLGTLSEAAITVYVDSGSTDGSVDWARSNGIEVLKLDKTLPFTAARARNAGFKRLQQLAPGVAYVQFIDGDCELVQPWSDYAVSTLDSRPDVGAVSGTRHERYPERSVYNWLCDREWNGPPGETLYCGGDVMMRVTAFEMVGGYREDLIAGEDPEICVRLRQAGWRIMRLDSPMTLHDAAMTRFAQWWRRAIRSGYVFAQGAHLHGRPPERHWVWESRRAWIWGFWLPLACSLAGVLFPPWGWASWIIYPAQMLRQTWRNPGALRDRVRLAFFQVLARFPEAWGQIKFMRNHVLGYTPNLIEYK